RHRHTQDLPSFPTRRSSDLTPSMTEPDQLVVGAKPVRMFAPSQVVRPNPIAPGSSIAKPTVGVETMQGPFAREPSVAVPARRSKDRKSTRLNSSHVSISYAV